MPRCSSVPPARAVAYCRCTASASRAAWTAGSNSAIRMPMIVITTKSSTRVKPPLFERLFIASPLLVNYTSEDSSDANKWRRRPHHALASERYVFLVNRRKQREQSPNWAAFQGLTPPGILTTAAPQLNRNSAAMLFTVRDFSVCIPAVPTRLSTPGRDCAARGRQSPIGAM
jgi:hypothetical protein